MYCPRCGIQTSDSATFCRGCGSNLSLVSQALTGQLVPATAKRDDDKEKKPPNLTDAFTSIFSGIGFVVMALASLYYAPAGSIWWYWILIPAFPLFGKGIANLVALRLGQSPAVPPQSLLAAGRNTGEVTAGKIAAGDTHRIAEPPPSVVEATTRHLDME